MESKVRPWGEYKVLLDTDYCKVKLITVNPHQRLSYQYHNKRSECWTVVKGRLYATIDDIRTFRDEGGNFFIPQGTKHRAQNISDEPIQFIEVQTGTYFGEDDIVRIEDDYNRK